MVSVKEGLDIATAGSRCFLKSDEKSRAQFIIFLASSLIGEPQVDGSAATEQPAQRQAVCAEARKTFLYYGVRLKLNYS